MILIKLNFHLSGIFGILKIATFDYQRIYWTTLSIRISLGRLLRGARTAWAVRRNTVRVKLRCTASKRGGWRPSTRLPRSSTGLCPRCPNTEWHAYSTLTNQWLAISLLTIPARLKKSNASASWFHCQNPKQYITRMKRMLYIADIIRKLGEKKHICATQTLRAQGWGLLCNEIGPRGVSHRASPFGAPIHALTPSEPAHAILLGPCLRVCWNSKSKMPAACYQAVRQAQVGLQAYKSPTLCSAAVMSRSAPNLKAYKSPTFAICAAIVVNWDSAH